ncbi:hypothetical protein KR084_003015, partial [Drosophila pseudotakahashii]
QQHQQLATVGAAHSTTSPEGSPTTTTTSGTQLSAFVQPPMTSSPPVAVTSLHHHHHHDTNNDNNNNNNSNIDAGFESDSISVTGSPRKSLGGSPLTHDEEEAEAEAEGEADEAETEVEVNSGVGMQQGPLGESSPGSGGAFTALIQRSGKNPSELFGHTNHFAPSGHSFNPALAAQLFLQSPLLPQSSQWLYTQLYGSYSDLPWLRNAAAAAAANISQENHPNPNVHPPLGSGSGNPEHDGVNLIKRCVTLITHNPPDAENANPNASPPVSSTRRSPSPVETIDLDDVSTTSRSASGSSGGAGGGPIRTRTPKPSADVWRPY